MPYLQQQFGTAVQAWMSNYMPHKTVDATTYPLPSDGVNYVDVNDGRYN